MEILHDRAERRSVRQREKSVGQRRKDCFAELCWRVADAGSGRCNAKQLGKVGFQNRPSGASGGACLGAEPSGERQERAIHVEGGGSELHDVTAQRAVLSQKCLDQP